MLLFLGVGFRNALLLFNAKRLVKKGYGYVRFFYPTGYPKNYLFDFKKSKDGLIEPLGQGEGSYIFKRKCVYINDYNIPTIDYMYGEADPIDPRMGLISVTNTKVLENVISAASKARNIGDINPFLDWLKKYWWLPLIIIGAFLVIIFLMYQSNNDALMMCMQQGRNAVINTTAIGK
jgi:hypothetical protein